MEGCRCHRRSLIFFAPAFFYHGLWKANGPTTDSSLHLYIYESARPAPPIKVSG
jgi:hypothetical protein